MLNSEYFAEEIGWIKSQELKDFAIKSVDLLPPYFAVNASSSSGKYHSKWSNGVGGLRLHTRAVCLVIWELKDCYGLTDIETDAALVAGLLHDAVKYDFDGKPHTVKNHAALGAIFFKRCLTRLNCENLTKSEEIYNAILDHYGVWSECTPKKHFPEDFPLLSQIVHIADMVASRKSIDFPSITQVNLIG